MKAPITYTPKFVPNADEAFQRLRTELEWERREDAPRSEYYCNDFPFPYVYGRGNGRRTYHPRPYHPIITEVRKSIEAITGTTFEVCFLNMYLDQSDSLGWHADDSPEMDDERPIAIVSFGVERDIMFREYLKTVCVECRLPVPNHKVPDCKGLVDPRPTVKIFDLPEILKLGHGSLCLMNAHMQETWLHRIPKASFKCGERISLTFRGYVQPSV